jgi:hypothetical protein
MRTSWLTCCATSPTNLLGSGKTSAQQVVNLLGAGLARAQHHDIASAQQVGQQVSGVYQPTSCTTSSCLVHQTQTSWPTKFHMQLVSQILKVQRVNLLDV